MAVSQEFEVENEITPRMAMCFGGGIGLTGAVCGAVSGAVMAIGLLKGPAGNAGEFQQVMSIAQAFRSRFEKEMKTMNCRELTGVDLAIPENFEQYMNSGTPQNVCIPAVETAYRIVMDLLKDAGQAGVKQ